MQSTAEDLYESCRADLFPSIATMCDYFGLRNQKKKPTDEELSHLLGLYQGVVNIIFKSDDFSKASIITSLQNAFHSNSLDKFIDNSYRFFKTKGGNPDSSAYYRWYKESNYKIGQTYYNLRAPEDR